MAYDAGLVERLRDALSGQEELIEKKMFGGVAFMVRGNMACGVLEDGLIVRVGRERYGEAVMEPHTKPLDITGRPMTGWVVVESLGQASDEDLERWVKEGVAFALTLPAK